jgi:hypothetical protein
VLSEGHARIFALRHFWHDLSGSCSHQQPNAEHAKQHAEP